MIAMLREVLPTTSLLEVCQVDQPFKESDLRGYVCVLVLASQKIPDFLGGSACPGSASVPETTPQRAKCLRHISILILHAT